MPEPGQDKYDQILTDNSEQGIEQENPHQKQKLEEIKNEIPYALKSISTGYRESTPDVFRYWLESLQRQLESIKHDDLKKFINQSVSEKKWQNITLEEVAEIMNKTQAILNFKGKEK